MINRVKTMFAANDGNGQGLLHLGARADAKGQGQEAQDRGEARHQDGPEAGAAGLAGAVAAYVGFGLPAFVLMLILSIAYRHAIDVRAVSSALTGLRVIVVALVANAAWTFGRSSVKGLREGAIAAVTAGLFLLGRSPFLIVVGAGIAGTLLLRGKIGPVEAKPDRPPGWRALAAPALVLGMAAVLIGILLVMDRRLAILGLVMMKVDAFAFGGGFASVPLMCREVVDVRGWMPLTSILDGIAQGR